MEAAYKKAVGAEKGQKIIDSVRAKCF